MTVTKSKYVVLTREPAAKELMNHFKSSNDCSPVKRLTTKANFLASKRQGLCLYQSHGYPFTSVDVLMLHSRERADMPMAG
tara:strand:+ start:334 stop:576 length:243 start_codon:yes stop_codon:yes gene_type:complete